MPNSVHRVALLRVLFDVELQRKNTCYYI
uniref:Uncharacterized protein n=1 Tax=Triticum urartu TaxID=4572 RepID=A0A8R7QIU9_TRIUA